MKTSQHMAPSPISPLNVFGMDLGLFAESFKRRWILLVLIASHRTFSALGTTLLNPFTDEQGLQHYQGWGLIAFLFKYGSGIDSTYQI